MKDIIAFIIFISAIVFLFGFSFSVGGDRTPEGQTIFLSKKCYSCHTIISLEINSANKNAVDLSPVSSSGNADFILKYLSKKEKINDKIHKATFKGTDTELRILSEWLAGLKAASN